MADVQISSETVKIGSPTGKSRRIKKLDAVCKNCGATTSGHRAVAIQKWATTHQCAEPKRSAQGRYHKPAPIKINTNGRAMNRAARN